MTTKTKAKRYTEALHAEFYNSNTTGFINRNDSYSNIYCLKPKQSNGNRK